MNKRNNPHWGSTLDDFLEEAGILEEVDAEARRRVREWQKETKKAEAEAKRRRRVSQPRPHAS